MSEPSGLVLTRSMLRVPIALAVVGALALVGGLIVAPERTWVNLLVDGFYVMSLGVSGIFFIATQRLSSAKWSASIRRVPEAFMMLIPAAIVLMAILAFGFRSLYPWIDPEAVKEPGLPFTPGRVAYLTPAFVYARMAFVLLVWAFFAWRIRKVSLDGDASRDAGLRTHRSLNRTSGVFAPVFALTI